MHIDQAAYDRLYFEYRILTTVLPVIVSPGLAEEYKFMFFSFLSSCPLSSFLRISLARSFTIDITYTPRIPILLVLPMRLPS
jgi:hypothetical protein